MAKANEQGKYLEQLVAWLQEEPGVIVERNVRLPVLGGGRTREFDILLSGFVATYPIRMVIECKNERKPIGAAKIDAFRGKLEAVGIPSSLGIYVSASGYTKQALDAARVAGVRALKFEGLSADRLSLEVSRALQSTVVLIPRVVGLEVKNDEPGPIEQVGEMFILYGEEDQLVGTGPDFVWQAWRRGDIAPQVGQSSLRLDAPGEWHSIIGGQRRAIFGMTVSIEIVALVMTIEGEARRAALKPSTPGGTEHQRFEATFDESTIANRYTLASFRSQDELDRYLASEALLHIVHYVKSPRIQFWDLMFWPPSERAAEFIVSQLRLFDEGQIPDPRPFSFAQIEGTDLGTAWEPIANDYLAGLREAKESVLWQAA